MVALIFKIMIKISCLGPQRLNMHSIYPTQSILTENGEIILVMLWNRRKKTHQNNPFHIALSLFLRWGPPKNCNFSGTFDSWSLFLTPNHRTDCLGLAHKDSKDSMGTILR